MHIDYQSLRAKAIEVLKSNDRGEWTTPAGDLYPHQWLWDSAFIAVGIAHYDIYRAQKEIESLLQAQWKNGMLPHMILWPNDQSDSANRFWKADTCADAPTNIKTSGFTQPPVLAMAVRLVALHLEGDERSSWIESIYPQLLKYHMWLYRERDVHRNGLVSIVHPWESGLDNSPPLMQHLSEQKKVLWMRALHWLGLEHYIGLFRKDTKFISLDERVSNPDSIGMVHEARKRTRQKYQSELMLQSGGFAVEDVSFNSILAAANTALRDMANWIDRSIPDELDRSMKATEKNLTTLWDARAEQFFSRRTHAGTLITLPSIATLLPLLSESLDEELQSVIYRMLKDPQMFDAHYPLPSVPLDALFYNHRGYWQGPTWINTNWLVIQGLLKHGRTQEALRLIDTSLELVQSAGFYEYFSARDGSGAGISNFSWTAALTLDLIDLRFTIAD